MKVEISNIWFGHLLSLLLIVGLNSCGNSKHSNEESSSLTDDTTVNQVGIAVHSDNYLMFISLDSLVEEARSDQMNITLDPKDEVQYTESELFSMTLDEASSFHSYSM